MSGFAGLKQPLFGASQHNRSSSDESRIALLFFDTTLRDGEQSPGASMTRKKRLRIAKAAGKAQSRC